jgi:hypothetical protein
LNTLAVLADPKRIIAEISLKVINDAKKELEMSKNTQESTTRIKVLNIVQPLDDWYLARA